MNVYIGDVGCQFRAVIEGRKIRVTNGGGCGDDAVGKTIPSGMDAQSTADLLRKRWIRNATRSMGERYDDEENQLCVTVDDASA